MVRFNAGSRQTTVGTSPDIRLCINEKPEFPSSSGRECSQEFFFSKPDIKSEKGVQAFPLHSCGRLGDTHQFDCALAATHRINVKILSTTKSSHVIKQKTFRYQHSPFQTCLHSIILFFFLFTSLFLLQLPARKISRLNVKLEKRVSYSLPSHLLCYGDRFSPTREKTSPILLT